MINITNIMIPNIYVNVKMNSLGTEDVSQYTLEDIRAALEKFEEAKDFFAHLVDLVHFDEKFPENQNIHITSVDKKPNWAIYVQHLKRTLAFFRNNS